MPNEIRYFSMFTGVGGFEIGIEGSEDRETTLPKDTLQPERNSSNNERRTWGCDTDFRRASNNRAFLQKQTSESLQGESKSKEGQTRFTCIGFSEIDKYANQLLAKRFPNIPNFGDCTKINPNELPDFDMLCGGFPCQSFSIAGKRRGFQDTRGTMFFEIARILEVKRPKIVFLENVKGLLNHDGGRTFKVICETLNSLGYIVNYEILNSKNFGVPQNRERVFIICHHINAIVEDGLTEKMSLLKRTILDYLFQLLLSNLKEVQKLQETKSKDWVLGYLCLKEISRNQKFRELVRTKVGLMIPTEEKILGLKEEDMWQSIELLLKTILEESYNELNKSITLTATKEITELKTYTYSELLMSILNLTVVLRNSSRNLWKQMLSFLILIKENTKYARVIDKTEKGIRTDTFNCYESRILQDAKRYFIIGSLRGESRPEILPFRFNNPEVNGINKESRQEINIIDDVARINKFKQGDRVKMDGNCFTLNSIEQRGIALVHKSKDQYWRVYSDEGLSPTLAGASKLSGDCTPKVAQCITSNYWKGNSNKKRLLGDFNRTELIKDFKIRRLTPIECERLQGFPDGWTEGFPDTQRYKMMGNAVTVKVISAIAKKLLEGKDEK